MRSLKPHYFASQVFLSCFVFLLGSPSGYAQAPGTGTYDDPTVYSTVQGGTYRNGVTIKRGQDVKPKTIWHGPDGWVIPGGDENSAPIGSTCKTTVVVKQKSENRVTYLNFEKGSTGEDNSFSSVIISEKTPDGMKPINVRVKLKLGTLKSWHRGAEEGEIPTDDDLTEYRYKNFEFSASINTQHSVGRYTATRPQSSEA